MTNQTQVKHTPTPFNYAWPYNEKEGNIINIISINNGGVADCFLNKYGHANNMNIVEANAQFIVKAVNCHDELVEACRIAYDALNPEMGRLTQSQRDLALSLLSKAISKAGE